MPQKSYATDAEQIWTHGWNPPVYRAGPLPPMASHCLSQVILSGEFCSEEGDNELEGLWATISVFITLFLLSVCYSATVTLFKVKWFFATVVQLKQTTSPN